MPTLLSCSGRLQAEGFPAPLSAGRTRLYDGEQVDAYLAGHPVPALPTADADDDLLDRQEAAALSGIPLHAWDRRKKNPSVSEHMVLVGGVEHWPRRIVRDYTPAPAPVPAEAEAALRAPVTKSRATCSRCASRSSWTTIPPSPRPGSPSSSACTATPRRPH